MAYIEYATSCGHGTLIEHEIVPRDTMLLVGDPFCTVDDPSAKVGDIRVRLSRELGETTIYQLVDDARANEFIDIHRGSVAV